MSDNEVSSEVYRGCTISIKYDECAENPRGWDNLGTFIGFEHRRYKIGDEQVSSLEDMTERLVGEGEYIGLPVSLYDHSGVSYSAGSDCDFSEDLTRGYGWDSGLAGFIFVTLENVRKEYGWKRVTKKRREQIVKYLKDEIKTYSEWANGDVYGFTTTDEHGNIIDSCYGFYGDSDDEYMLSEAKSSIDYYVETERPRRIRAEFKERALKELQGVG